MRYIKIIVATIVFIGIRLAGQKIMTVKGIPVIMFTGKMAKRVLKYTHGCEYVAVYRGILFPYIAYVPLKGAPFMTGCILHEVGHIKYAPAQCPPGVKNKNAHKGKGARYEHQADKFAVNLLLQIENGHREIQRFCQYLEQMAAGDGAYRAKLIKRYVRRYYKKEL